MSRHNSRELASPRRSVSANGPYGLFVYGTLKHGGSNYWRVEELVREVLPGWMIYGQLYNAGSYPGLVVPGDRKIRGEVLMADSPDELLGVTDELEGDEYRRVLVPVINDDGDGRMVWAYFYNRDFANLERLDIDEWIEPAQS